MSLPQRRGVWGNSETFPDLEGSQVTRTPSLRNAQVVESHHVPHGRWYGARNQVRVQITAAGGGQSTQSAGAQPGGKCHPARTHSDVSAAMFPTVEGSEPVSRLLWRSLHIWRRMGDVRSDAEAAHTFPRTHRLRSADESRPRLDGNEPLIWLEPKELQVDDGGGDIGVRKRASET